MKFVHLVLAAILLFSCTDLEMNSKHSQNQLIDCKKNNLNAIGIGDTLQISLDFSGCEMHFKETLDITRTEEGLSAILCRYNDWMNKGKKTITAELDDDNINSFYAFENAAKNRKPSEMYCTNNEKYQIRSMDGIFRFEDNSCSFHEYDDLKKSFFGEKKLKQYWKSINQ